MAPLGPFLRIAAQIAVVAGGGTLAPRAPRRSHVTLRMVAVAWWLVATILVLFGLARQVAGAHARTTLLISQNRRSASAVGSVAAEAAAYVPRTPVGGQIELEPADLAQYIATGVMPASALQTSTGAGDPVPDPYEEQANNILENLDNYGQQLKKAGQTAEDKRKDVQDQEDRLEQNFAPTQKALQDRIQQAATEAGKAEATTMLERMTKMHHDQVAILDRSARFWEEQIAKEKELTRVTEAKTRLEESALNSIPMQNYVEAKQMEVIRDAEKARLDKWLEGYNVQLTEEEKAVLEKSVDYYPNANFTQMYPDFAGTGKGPLPQDLVNMRLDAIQQTAAAAESSTAGVYPKVKLSQGA